MMNDALIANVRLRLNFFIDQLAKDDPNKAAKIRDLILPTFRMIDVVLDAVRARHVGKKAGVHQVLLVLQDEPQSVFFDIQCGDFGACWGPDAATGELIDLGFRGDDPVEIYSM